MSPKTAFEVLYHAEYPQLARLAYAMCGNRTEAEELAQEVLTRAFANWETVSRLDQPGAWCRRVLLNDVIGRSRRRSTDRRKRGLFAVPERSTDSADGSSEAELLWAEVRRLPQRQAQAVALVYGLDLSAADAGEVLGLDASSVRSHLHTARRTLSKRLGPEWRGE